MFVLANIFQPLIDVFETVLKFFHNSVGVPWGWSIILLTIVVRACLIPLTVKQFGSMQRLQQLQPELRKRQVQPVSGHAHGLAAEEGVQVLHLHSPQGDVHG